MISGAYSTPTGLADSGPDTQRAFEALLRQSEASGLDQAPYRMHLHLGPDRSGAAPMSAFLSVFATEFATQGGGDELLKQCRSVQQSAGLAGARKGCGRFIPPGKAFSRNGRVTVVCPGCSSSWNPSDLVDYTFYRLPVATLCTQLAEIHRSLGQADVLLIYNSAHYQSQDLRDLVAKKADAAAQARAKAQVLAHANKREPAIMWFRDMIGPLASGRTLESILQAFILS